MLSEMQMNSFDEAVDASLKKKKKTFTDKKEI